METMTLEVELHSEHAKLLKALIEEQPNYLSHILTQHLARKLEIGTVREKQQD